MDKATILHNITPEQLKDEILEGVEKRFNKLTEHFQPKKPTEYLTRNEVKDLLKVNLSTVYHWTKKGKLKSYGIEGRVFYKRDEVEKALVPLL